MTDLANPSPAAPPPLADGQRQTVLIVYILMLVPVVVPITHLVGLVMAYVSRDSAPDWLKTHYTNQIRTFWVGMLYLILSALACFLLIGFVLVPLVCIWYIVRCAIGLSRLMNNQPYPNPDSWTL